MSSQFQCIKPDDFGMLWVGDEGYISESSSTTVLCFVYFVLKYVTVKFRGLEE